jgi:penicillin amidase
VMIHGKEEKMLLHDEIIHVKDSNDVRIVVRTTSHGPVCSDVMNDFDGLKPAPVSACWTLLKFPCNLLEVAYGLGHSTSMSGFRQRVAQLVAPGLNFIYADNSDNIAWYAGAKFVQRRPGVPAHRILDGSDSTMEWMGYYDFSRNPMCENPACGFVFSCNNQPDSVQGVLYPGYYLTDERALRMKELLQKKKTYSLHDVQQICLDYTNPNTAQIAKVLTDNVNNKVIANLPQGAAMLNLLSQWKGSHAATDNAPAVYYVFLYKTLYKALSDEMGEKDFQALVKTHSIKFTTMAILTNANAPWWDNTKTPEKETREDIITSAFKETVSTITEFAGTNPENWRWDNMHFLEFKHPVGKMIPLDKLFNVGPVATTGGVETINNQSFTYTDKLPFTVGFGPALRRCVDFADPENAFSVSPSGQSGNPMSKHYADQAGMYARGEFRKEMMNRDSIVASSHDVIIFTGH